MSSRFQGGTAEVSSVATAIALDGVVELLTGLATGVTTDEAVDGVDGAAVACNWGEGLTGSLAVDG